MAACLCSIPETLGLISSTTGKSWECDTLRTGAGGDLWDFQFEWLFFSSFPFKMCFILCVWVLCPPVCVCAAYTPGARGGPKRASDSLALELQMDGCEPPCACWELNSGPRREQQALRTAEISPAPWPVVFKLTCIWFTQSIFSNKTYGEPICDKIQMADGWWVLMLTWFT